MNLSNRSAESCTIVSPLRDSSGAILVLGLVLGVVLALAVNTLVGVGDAVLERETAQSAADAAAFESAVWHARGMNMVATINVLIAIVLGALVFWRLATFVVALASLLQAVSLLQQPSSQEPEILELAPLVKLLDGDEQIAGNVLLVASALRVAQTAVAAYTPVLAAHASVLDTEAAYGTASGTFSASLLPNGRTNELKSLARCLGGPAGSDDGAPAPGGRSTRPETLGLPKRAADDVEAMLDLAQRGPKLPAESPRLGMPFSLPVAAAAHSLVCERATLLGNDAQPGAPNALVVHGDIALDRRLDDRELHALHALGLGSKADGLLRSIRELSGVVEQKAPSVFCAPAGGNLDALRASMWRLAGGLSAYAPAETKRRLVARLAPRALPPTEPNSLKEAAAIWQAWQQALESGESPERCIRPAEVWSPAANGNGFMRSASASEVAIRRDDLAAMGQTESEADRRETTHRAPLRATSQAEIFFDCGEVWSNCRSNALWQPSWTARLRRVRSFRTLIAPNEARPGLAAVDQRVVAGWLDRVARQLGGVRRASNALDAQSELELEPETVAETWTFGLLEAAAGATTEPRRPLSAFVARHASDSSVVH